MNILAVVAHPDDETLGCGGTLTKHSEAGDRVDVAIMARPGLEKEAAAACGTLGVTYWTQGGYQDQGLDTIPAADLIGLLERVYESDPDIVYTHNPDDLNLDHQITARAVLTAFRPCSSKATILAFETISSTEWSPEPFAPNYWVELTKEHAQRKCDALDCYPSERWDWPHPRNHKGIWTWAQYRGAQAGVPYAEAFKLIRCVD